jgi:CheY-like chemotaxis protein
MPLATERSSTISPCLILAQADPQAVAPTAIWLRRQGWDVYPVHTGPEARRLARMLQPDVVVLHTDLPEESGWLTCEKLVRDLPGVKVLLYAPEALEPSADFAAFVGAVAVAGTPAELARHLRAFLPRQVVAN